MIYRTCRLPSAFLREKLSDSIEEEEERENAINENILASGQDIFRS
jgi:hypothetical protein